MLERARSGATSSWSRSTTNGAGTATTTCSPTPSAPGSPRTDADRARELTAPAARWYADHGMLADAVPQAVAGGDDELAADLVELALPGAAPAPRGPHCCASGSRRSPDDVVARSARPGHGSRLDPAHRGRPRRGRALARRCGGGPRRRPSDRRRPTGDLRRPRSRQRRPTPRSWRRCRRRSRCTARPSRRHAATSRAPSGTPAARWTLAGTHRPPVARRAPPASSAWPLGRPATSTPRSTPSARRSAACVRPATSPTSSA